MSASDQALQAINEHVDAAFATVGEPIRYASLFYALYYLVEIEGDDRAAFDFQQIREIEAEGFFWYGVASITREMAHIDDRYFIEGEGMSTIDNVEPGEVITTHIETELFPDRPERHQDAKQVMATVPTLWNIETPQDMTRTFQELERVFGAVTDPMDYIELIRDMFEATPSPSDGAAPGTMKRRNKTGWAHGYDGPPWVSICEHLLRRDSLSSTAFVDQSWSIQHNNNRWIDKVDLFTGGEQTDAIEDVLGFSPRRGNNASPPQVEEAVNEILDAAQDGRIGDLFAWAAHFNDDVEFNLRRYRRFVSGND